MVSTRGCRTMRLLYTTLTTSRNAEKCHFENQKPDQTATSPLTERRRRSSMLVKSEKKCENGRARFTNKGTSAYVRLVARLDCGRSAKQKRDVILRVPGSHSSHDLIDPHGTQRYSVFGFSVFGFSVHQCCMYMDAHERMVVEHMDHMHQKVMGASTTPQRLASSVFDK